MAEIKTDIRKGEITLRLYSIQNIAYLTADCPEDKADICVLQGAALGIGRLIQCLIDDLDD